MMQTNVLCIWDVREELQNYLRKGLENVENLNLIFLKDTSEENLLKHAPDAQIVIGWRPTREFLDTAQNMKLFINPGVGVQHHIETFRELTQTRDITLINGHGNTYFTAQHAVALLMAATNKVIPHHNWMTKGLWRRGDDYAKSVPLRARKIGLLGYGAVNQKVHKFLSGFDVEFLVLKRTWNEDEEFPTPVKQFLPKNLDNFLKETDMLMIAVPQTEETIGMIGEKELKLLGPESFLVNVARGIVIDEEALYHALKDKVIAGAGIDVWYEYRPEPDVDNRKYPTKFPFHELDNVVLSPHRGASPMDDLQRWDEVIENVTKFAEGRKDFINVVKLDRAY
ncbi:MAG: NAD(P)-dependent oxidoreductase [Candidatus Thorarchaeota archaeon]